MSSDSLVSVIIPVAGTGEQLPTIIDRLVKQEPREGDHEIIIVDNNPTPTVSLPPIPHKVKILVVHEPSPGSYTARNRGLSEALGDILFFTDADCLPATNWITEGIKSLATGDSDLIGGRIELYPRNSRPTACELYDMAFNLKQEYYVRYTNAAATANLIAYRYIFAKIGGFRSDLRSGGDMEWTRRAVAAGYRLTYTPAATIYHPARASFRDLLNKERRKMAAHRKNILTHRPLPTDPPRMTLDLRFRHFSNRFISVARTYGPHAFLTVAGIYLGLRFARLFIHIASLNGKGNHCGEKH